MNRPAGQPEVPSTRENKILRIINKNIDFGAAGPSRDEPGRENDQFFKKITPIIEKYVSEKNIDMVLDKKKVFVASKKKDITKEIIKIINTNLK